MLKKVIDGIIEEVFVIVSLTMMMAWIDVFKMRSIPNQDLDL